MRLIPGLMPWQCDHFTLTEIDFVLTDSKDHCPDGRRSMTDMEMDAEWLWWQGLSARERLELGER